MRIIPAIDIYKGKIVRLYQGNYSFPKWYSTDPLEMAKKLQDLGFRYVHIVDLEGARTGQPVIFDIVEKICSSTTLLVDVGGGIRNIDIAKKWFDVGVHQINVGTSIVKDINFFIELINLFGSEKIIFSADVKNEIIQISGWLESSRISIFDFLEGLYNLGLKYVACTDIERDGTLRGPNFNLYQKGIRKIPINWIASGGIRTIDDIEKLKEIGCEACIIGKAIYEYPNLINKISQLC